MGLSKKCFKCQETKDITEFYAHPKMSDGTVNKCKTCNKLDVRVNRKNKIQYYQTYDLKRTKLDSRVKHQKSRRTVYLEEYPERISANKQVTNAIKNGKLLRPAFCEHCWQTCKPDAHHISYSKDMWLVVIWLCKSCHLTLHSNFKYKINEWETP